MDKKILVKLERTVTLNGVHDPLRAKSIAKAFIEKRGCYDYHVYSRAKSTPSGFVVKVISGKWVTA